MTVQRSIGRRVDAVVIGGGFYGCAIAIYLARQRGVARVLLVEQEPAIMTRASYNNQARVHNGYHYPRSFVTAHRSRVNLPKFVRDRPDAVKSDFTKLYAIARRNSKVTAKQFQRFCKEIGASLEPADLSHRQLFESRLIEEVYLAQEYVFDSTLLAKWAAQELSECGVETLLQTKVSKVFATGHQELEIELQDKLGPEHTVKCRWLFNCTYSGLNQLGGDFNGTNTRLKQEITEMALMQMPSSLEGLGVTVMDGPFFSMMPFPPRGLHTLSHVRYTPHVQWMDERGIDPYQRLAAYHKEIRVARMVRDVRRYMPAILEAEYKQSLFEIKTVLMKNESDDGRPILFERFNKIPNIISVLGGKIDNIYDVIEKLSTLEI
jgi:glycine/D-amino acid oxidase-like deaminating enzyme